MRLVRPPLDWALLFALSLLWGGAFMFQALAVASVGPATATAIRLVLAALALCAMLRLGLRRLPRDRRLWAWLAAIALLGNVLPFALTTWAQERIDSNLAGVLTASAPLVAVTLAHFFMPGERLTAKRLLGVALGFAGVGVLLGPGAEFAGSEPTAVGMVLAAAACYGATAVVAARMPDLPALPAAAGVLLIAAAIATPAAFAFERPMRQAAIDATGVASVAGPGPGSHGDRDLGLFQAGAPGRADLSVAVQLPQSAGRGRLRLVVPRRGAGGGRAAGARADRRGTSAHFLISPQAMRSPLSPDGCER